MISKYFKILRILFLLVLYLASRSSFAQSGFIPFSSKIFGNINEDRIKYVNTFGPLNTLITQKGFIYQNTTNEIGNVQIRENIAFDFNQKEEINWQADSIINFSNYYLSGKNRTEKVPIYKSLSSELLWDSIQCIFNMDNMAKPKYNFIGRLKNIKSIKITINGIDSLSVCKNELIIFSKSGSIYREDIPNSYLLNRTNKKIDVYWKKHSNNTIGFYTNADSIDIESFIVIDPLPVLKWATYFGGSGNDQGYCVASNTIDGHAYFGGKTSSTTKIASINTHQTSVKGSEDAFLTKFSKEGGSTSRIWATYFGGNGSDIIHGITVDKDNRIIVVGESNSDSSISYNTNYKTTRTGKKDAFVAVFNDSGKIIWSTFIGGKEDDMAYGVAADKAGNIIIVGSTFSDSISDKNNNSNITIHQTNYKNNGDGFITKLDSSGNIIFTTYLGGKGSDQINGVTIGFDDTIYIVGTTNSDSIGATNTYSKASDLLLAKFSPNGAARLIRYFGDTGEDYGHSIRFVDSIIYITGKTNSHKNIAYQGFQDSINAGSIQSSTNSDAILLQTNSNLKINWSTYYGGDENDEGNGVDVDDSSYVYLGGTTESSNNRNHKKNIIATPAAFKTNKNAQDAFVVKFDKNGNRKWGSYFGGPDNDNCFGIAHGRFGDIYIVGQTKSDSNLTKRAYQNIYGTATDAYFADLTYCEDFAIIKKDTVCENDTITVSFTDSSNYFLFKDSKIKDPWAISFPKFRFRWIKYNNQNEQVIDSINSKLRIKFTRRDTGNYKLIVTDSFGCIDTVLFKLNYYFNLPENRIVGDSILCNWDTLHLKLDYLLKPKENLTWYFLDSNVSNNQTSYKINHAFNKIHSGTYKILLTDSNLCSILDSINIQIGTDADINSNSPICFLDTIKLQINGRKLRSGFWENKQGSKFNSTDTFFRINSTKDTGLYNVIVTDSFGCIDTIEYRLSVFKIQSFTITSKDSVCAGDSIYFSTQAPNSAKTTWYYNKKIISTDSTLTINKITLDDSGFYKIIFTDSNNCNIDTQLFIKVLKNPTPKINGNTVFCFGDSLSILLIDTTFIKTSYWTHNSTQYPSSLIKGKLNFSDSGEYTLTLIDSNNCRMDTSVKVKVNRLPVSTFSTNNFTQCLKGNKFIFKYNQIPGKDSITVFTWYINNNLQSNNSSEFTVTFDTIGIQKITLSVTNSFGCSHDTSFSVTILQNPTAKISIKDTVLCLRGNEFDFNDGGSSAAGNANISNFYWDFDLNGSSANPDTAISRGPHKVSYYSIGTKNTRLIVKDNNGCLDTAFANIRVLDHPNAVISNTYNDSQCFKGNLFRFNDSASTFVSKPLAFNWLFDVGGNSASKSSANNKGPHKINYNSTGYKNIQLIVTDSNSCADTVLSRIRINLHPVSKIRSNFDFACFRNQDFQITADSSLGNTKVLKSRWYYNGISNLIDTIGNINYSFADTGEHKIFLIITNEFGCFDTTNKTFNIRSHPVAKITSDFDTSCFKTQFFNFQGDSSVATKSSKISNYNWTLPSSKSTFVNEQRIGSIVFDSIGNHELELIITDSNSCKDTVKYTINVAPHPIARIFQLDSSICANIDSAFFKANSTLKGGKYPINHDWTYFDTVNRIGDSISVLFRNSGSFKVRLIAESQNGCLDTAHKTIYVDTTPNIKIKLITSDEQCFSLNNFTIIDDSKNKTAIGLNPSKVWYISDGRTLINRNDTLKHIFKKAGNYTIYLKRETQYGCKSSDSISVKVNPNPVTEIVKLKDLNCHTDSIAMLAASSTNGTEPIKYKWNNENYFSNVLRSGLKEGYYSVRSFDDKGCEDTADIYIKAPDSMYLDILFADPSCKGANDGNAKVEIKGGNGAPFKYKWSKPRLRYSDTLNNLPAGTYTVQVTDSKGCMSVKDFILIAPDKLELDFELFKSISCFGSSDGQVIAKPTGGLNPYYFSLNNQNYTLSDTFKNLSEGFYYVNVKDQKGCFTSDSFGINNPPEIKISYNIDSIKCKEGEDGRISLFIQGGTPGYRYNWANSKNTILGTQKSIDNLKADIYKAYIYDVNNCSDSATIHLADGVAYLNKPIFSEFYCRFDSIILSNSDDRIVTWRTPNNIKTDKKLIIRNFTSRDTGNYIIESKNDSGCVYKDTFKLRIYPDYVKQIDTTVCEGSAFSVYLGNPKKAQWYKNNLALQINPNNQLWIPSTKLTDSGVYKVFYQTQYGCKDTIDFSLKIPEKLFLSDNNGQKYNVCEGEILNISINTNKAYSGFWKTPSGLIENVTSNFGFSKGNIELGENGYFRLFGLDLDGCRDTLNVLVNIGKKPTVNLFMNMPEACIFPKEKKLYIADATIGNHNTTIYLNDSLITRDRNSIPLIFNHPGYNKIKLLVNTFDGCNDSTITYFEVKENPKVTIPNAFTPNGDFLNETFHPVVNSSIDYYNMKIFNRWGEKIFEGIGNSYDDYAGGKWDGKFSTKLAQNEVYIYLIEAVDICNNKLYYRGAFLFLK